MKIDNTVIIIFLFFLAVFVAVNIFIFRPENKQKSVFSYGQEVLMPFGWGLAYTDDIKNKVPLKAGENLHPLNLGRITLFLLNDGTKNNDKEELALARVYLDFLADSYPSTFENDKIKIWKYQFAWDELKPGWYSGMANSAIALAFLAGYETFGEEKYKLTAEKAMNGVVEPTTSGGCAVLLDIDKYWFEEYAYDGADKSNTKFVNNGFLFSLLAVKIFYDVTDNPYYVKKYEEGFNGLKDYESKFYYPDKTWTYYNLNPKTIESPHYAIYDMLLYKALLSLTKDSFFQDQLTLRQRIMMDAYPLSFCTDSDGKNRFIFSLIGPPHPYWIDVYPIQIDILNKEGKVIDTKKIDQPRNFDIPLTERAFISGILDVMATKYRIYSNYEKDSFLWQEMPIKKSKKSCEAMAQVYKYGFSCAYDAVLIDDHCVNIDPSRITNAENKDYYSNNQGVLIFDPEIPINRRLYKYFGLIIDPQKEINSMQISIFDSNGKEANRYYEKLRANSDNIVLLQWSGFNHLEELNDDVVRVIATIYTKDYKSSEKFSIEVNDFVVFKNELEMYNALKGNLLYLPEDGKRGNIY